MDVNFSKALAYFLPEPEGEMNVQAFSRRFFRCGLGRNQRSSSSS
jgi:hypothetical protein